MTRAIGCYLVILIIGIGAAFAQSPGTVVLSLDKYEAIRKQVEQPSLEYILSTAQYQATVKDNEVTVRGNLRAILFTDKPTIIPLFQEGVMIDRAMIGDEPAILSADSKGQIVWALLGKPGEEIKLELEFRSPVERKKGFYNTALSIPPAGARVTVDFPYDEVQAHINDQYQDTRRNEQNHSILVTSITGKPFVLMTWLPLSKSVQPEITTSQTMLIRHPNIRQVDYQVNLQVGVANRPVTELTIPLDETLRVGSLSGPRVATYQTKANMLKVQFREPIIGQEELQLSLYRMVDETEKPKHVVPRIQVDGASGTSGYVAFAESDLFKISITQQENIQTVAPDQIPDRSLKSVASQAFYFWNPDYRLEYRLEPIEPEFTAAVYHGISFGETTCILDTRYECTISQGAIHTFELTQPEGFKLEAVSGDSVRDWSVVPETNAIQVILNRAERRKTIFSLKYRRDYKDAEPIPILLPEIAGPKRFRGFVSITPQTAVRITIENVNNLEPLSSEQIPSPLKGESDVAPLFAYRFLEQPASLSLATQRFDKAEVETTRIEKMIVALKYPAPGTLQTESFVDVRNTSIDMLPIRVFPGISIRECQVDGFDFQPAVGDAPDTLLFPIPKSRNKTSTIWLSYLSTVPSLDQIRVMNLPIPKVTLPVDDFGLLLSLPGQYQAELVSKGRLEPSSEIPAAYLPQQMMEMQWVTGPAGSPEDAPDEVKRINVALETYYIDNNTYPPVLQCLTTPWVHLSEYSDNFLEKYKYETNLLGFWKLGYRQKTTSEDKAERSMGEGAYYKAAFLRGDEEALRDQLTVQAKIQKVRAGGLSFLTIAAFILLVFVLLIIGSRMIKAHKSPE